MEWGCHVFLGCDWRKGCSAKCSQNFMVVPTTPALQGLKALVNTNTSRSGESNARNTSGGDNFIVAVCCIVT